MLQSASADTVQPTEGSGSQIAESGSARRPLVPFAWLWMAGCFAVIFAVAARPMTDNDVWWHLATGRYILDYHLVPHGDVFSFTAFGQTWITHEWLTEVLLAVLWAVGGSPLLTLLFASLITATFVIVYRTTRAYGATQVVPALALTVWAALASAHTWGVRPQMFSMLFTAIYAATLLDSETTPLSTRRFVALTVSMVAWANLHGGFIFGLAIIGLHAVSAWLPVIGQWLMQIGQILSGPEDQPFDDLVCRVRVRAALRLTLLLVAATAMTMLTPDGWHTTLYPFSYLGNNASVRFIAEWQSPDFHQVKYLLFEGLVLATVISFAFSTLRVRLWEILAVIVFLYLGLQSVRNISLYSVMVTPIIGRHLQAVLAVWASTIRASWQRPQRPPRRRRQHPVLNIIFLLGILIEVLWAVGPQAMPAAQATAVQALYPVRAVDYILLHPVGQRTAQGVRVGLFNSYNWGGYLIWRLYPRYRVYVDGRPDMYGDRFMNTYMAIYQADPGWQHLLDSQHIRAILIEPGSTLARVLALSPVWHLAYRDALSVLYVR